MLDDHATDPNRTPIGRPRVLVIDDQDDVREANAAALEHAGYFVDRASSWMEALGLTARDGLRVDVIVTDLVIPGDGGIETLVRLRRYHGSTPVVVLSGYASAMRLLSGVLDGVVEWLRKPMEVCHVVEAVGRARSRASA